jgi:L-alanine-DL-glutamate epimerase-like enolase superfamily enzyme
MKIDRIETYSDKDNCMVRVCAGDAEGWGMSAPFNSDISALLLHRVAAHHVLGRDTDDFRSFADEIMTQEYKFTGSFLARAAAGIDTALWDLQGKVQNKSVAELVGKKQDAIDLYGSSMRRKPQPVESEAERLLGFCKKYGFRAIKLHPCEPMAKDVDYYPGHMESFIKASREALPSDVELFVDVNGHCSVERAIELAKFLKENGVSFFEEPCPYWDLDDVKQVREFCKSIGMPIAAGEQDYMNTQWNRMIKEHIVDIAQPDLLYCGGFTRALRIAEQSAAAGIPVTPHTSNRSMIFVLGLHYMASVDMPYPFLECGVEFKDWEVAAYEGCPEIVNGRAQVPVGPGWGVKPRQSWLDASTYEVSKL